VNLLKSKLRRATAVAAGTLIGLAGVAYFASPASAHGSVVSGTAECDVTTGEYVVKWTVNTDNGAQKDAENYRFIRVESSPTPVDGIAHTPDDNEPVFPYASNKPLEGVQRVAGDTKEAKLLVQVKWSDDWIQYDPAEGTVHFDGTCTKDAPKPDASLASSCAGVTVTLANGKDAKLDAEFTIKGSKDFEKKVTVKAGADAITVDIPAENALKIIVLEQSSEKPVLVGKWEEPKDCTPAEDQFEAGYEVTCDSLIFGVDNTKGTKTVTIKLTTNKGESKTLVAKAGEEKTVTVKGEKGLVVDATINGEVFEPVKWDDLKKPEDCTASPAPTDSAPGGGGGLPLTGPVAGSIAGGAALLLAVGAVLFILARRRKVKFTA